MAFAGPGLGPEGVAEAFAFGAAVGAFGSSGGFVLGEGAVGHGGRDALGHLGAHRPDELAKALIEMEGKAETEYRAGGARFTLEAPLLERAAVVPDVEFTI